MPPKLSIIPGVRKHIFIGLDYHINFLSTFVLTHKAGSVRAKAGFCQATPLDSGLGNFSFALKRTT